MYASRLMNFRCITAASLHSAGTGRLIALHRAIGDRMQHSSGASTARRQLYREPRVTVIERPDSERRGCEADQLDSLLTELLSLRSAQAYMLEQPSVLMASCSLLPPCCNATAPNFSSCCSALMPHRRALEASSSTAANGTAQSLSPTVSLLALPTLITTLSSWWG